MAKILIFNILSCILIECALYAQIIGKRIGHTIGLNNNNSVMRGVAHDLITHGNALTCNVRL